MSCLLKLTDERCLGTTLRVGDFISFGRVTNSLFIGRPSQENSFFMKINENYRLALNTEVDFDLAFDIMKIISLTSGLKFEFVEEVAQKIVFKLIR